MGFDIKGQKGNSLYFSCWGWRPIQLLVTALCSDFLTKKEITDLGFNDGQHYNKTKANKIAVKLKDFLAEKNKENYEKIKTSIMKSLGEDYKNCWDKNNIKKFAEFLRKFGGFDIY